MGEERLGGVGERKGEGEERGGKMLEGRREKGTVGGPREGEREY